MIVLTVQGRIYWNDDVVGPEVVKSVFYLYVYLNINYHYMQAMYYYILNYLHLCTYYRILCFTLFLTDHTDINYYYAFCCH